MRIDRQPPLRRLASRFRSHQRLLGAAFARLAAFLAIAAITPDSPETVDVVAAAADIAGGHVIAADDLMTRQLPAHIAAETPRATSEELIGRVTTGPIAMAELMTTTRVVGPALLDQINKEGSPSGDVVAAPVRLADPSQAQLLHAGDRIDVLAARPTDSGGQKASTVAVDVAVLSVPSQTKESSTGGLMAGSGTPVGTGSNNLVLVAVDRGTAIDLAAAATRSQLSVVLKRSTL